MHCNSLPWVPRSPQGRPRWPGGQGGNDGGDGRDLGLWAALVEARRAYGAILSKTYETLAPLRDSKGRSRRTPTIGEQSRMPYRRGPRCRPARCGILAIASFFFPSRGLGSAIAYSARQPCSQWSYTTALCTSSASNLQHARLATTEPSRTRSIYIRYYTRRPVTWRGAMLSSTSPFFNFSFRVRLVGITIDRETSTSADHQLGRSIPACPEVFRLLLHPRSWAPVRNPIGVSPLPPEAQSRP